MIFINRPIFTIFRLLFRPIFRFYGMPMNLIPICNLLWNSTTLLVSLIGIFPTMRVLYGFRKFNK